MKNTKVIFMGTPEFAVPVLQTLIDNTNVVLVVTQPDKYVGRNKVLTPTPVKVLAQENNIEVYFPELKLCTDNAAMIAAAGYYNFIEGKRAELDLNAIPNLKLTNSLKEEAD